jgi:hypothetical protein
MASSCSRRDGQRQPIYGQGMTVAALQALASRDQLLPGTTPSARSVLRALARVIDAPAPALLEEPVHRRR